MSESDFGGEANLDFRLVVGCATVGVVVDMFAAVILLAPPRVRLKIARKDIGHSRKAMRTRRPAPLTRRDCCITSH